MYVCVYVHVFMYPFVRVCACACVCVCVCVCVRERERERERERVHACLYALWPKYLSEYDPYYFYSYRYVPLDWASKKELTVEEVKKLNQHNTELVKGLLQYTDLYTSYQHGNFTCIALKSVC